MAAIPKSLSYFLTRMTGYSRNSTLMRAEGQDQARPGQTVVVNLPQGDPDPDTGEVPTVPHRVLPTHYKCPLSGAAMPVENPEVWVYPETSNDPQESE